MQRCQLSQPCRQQVSARRSLITIAIQLSQVCKQFTLPRAWWAIARNPFARKRLQVLHDVSFQVFSEGRTALLGPNGAGKTTLLRILAGTILPDSGQVVLLGQDIKTNGNHLKRQIGFVQSDERSFYWRLTGRQNLHFFATLQNLERQKRQERLNVLCEQLQLTDEIDKPFRDLSTGMRHRLALARALLTDPPILLLDEPTRGLDPGSAKRVRVLLAEKIAAQAKKTILLATHNLHEAEELCDQVVLLKKGRVVGSGSTKEMMTKTTSFFDLEGEG